MQEKFYRNDRERNAWRYIRAFYYPIPIHTPVYFEVDL